MESTKHQLELSISSRNILAGGWLHLVLSHPEGEHLPVCRPGQFVEVAVERARVLLNRPFSVYYSNSHRLELLVAPLGRASSELANYNVGDCLRVIMPLGKGFSQPAKGSRVLLAGGGVGIAPLYYQACVLAEAGVHVEVVYGMRTAPDRSLCARFEKVCPLHICTDDGTAGFHGLVTDHPVFNPAKFDAIQICGPMPMMKACARKIKESAGVFTEISLENHMACGLGACLCCVEDTADRGNVCVCKDGPVFNLNQLKW